MSFDITIGKHDFNCTYNLSPLFYDHIPATEGCRGGLNELHGLTGRAAFDLLAGAFDRINQSYCRDWRERDVGSPVFCARYDPPNGWGSTVGGLVFLARVMAACAANPRKTVRVS